MQNVLLGVLGGGGLVFLLGALAQPDPHGPPNGPPHGPDGRPPRPKIGHVVPPFVRPLLQLTDQQKEQIAEIEHEVRGRLDKILTPEQIETFDEALRKGPPPRPHGPPQGPPPCPPPGPPPGGPPPEGPA